MSLNQVNILHITDLHIKTKEGKNPLDKVRLSEGLKQSLGPVDPREIFLTRISSLLKKSPIDVLAFTGDITSDIDFQNCYDTMKIGIEYLDKIRKRLNIDKSKVIISPGNHDLLRHAEQGKEFDQLCTICAQYGFSVALPSEPIFSEINGIPLISVNTCIGGTEHAFHGVPKKFWKAVKDAIGNLEKLSKKFSDEIPEEIKSQLVGLDVPAIGQIQLDKIYDYLNNFIGNCTIILGHHNLLPTHQMVVRPYADLVDAGKFIFKLLNQEKRVIFLHGHTHCDTSLKAHSPEEEKGFIACLGTNGLHRVLGGMPSAAHIKIFADDDLDFLAAIITRFSFKGADFFRQSSFSIFDDYINPAKLKLPIDDLNKRITYSFEEVKEKLNISESDQNILAIELLRRNCTKQIALSDIGGPFTDWKITKSN